MSAHILLVDDDPDLLRLLSLRLQAAGYRTSFADSGETAIADLAALAPDLVITDLRMSGMDGLALFDAIRCQDPDLPVLVLSAHGSIPEAVTAASRGVTGFISKPFNGQSLLREVERALAQTAPRRYGS